MSDQRSRAPGQAIRRWVSRRADGKHGVARASALIYRTVQRWGWTPAYDFALTAYAPSLPGWPVGMTLTMTVITDVHYGSPNLQAAELSRIIDAANALDADLIVLVGDYGATHHTPPEHRDAVTAFARAAARLSARLGVFAVLGNHDWWDDPDAQRERHGPPVAARALAAAGIEVLENHAVRLVTAGGPFWLAGLGDQCAFLGPLRGGVDDLDGTLAEVTDDAPVILLAHEPDIFPAVPTRVALTLSGHTHGGQIKVMGRTPVVPSRYGSRFARGHVVEDGRHLIVSAGLGVSTLPFRVGVPPELLTVQLGPAGAASDR